eukprot:5373971-Amphidinium_carterae.1
MPAQAAPMLDFADFTGSAPSAPSVAATQVPLQRDRCAQPEIQAANNSFTAASSSPLACSKAFAQCCFGPSAPMSE